ncbi:MAG: hypothetical protein MUE53_01985 [Chitinophagales bacterium]|jgi:membrane-associated phospholipid phosphatase|nr:hypothetical protein [Chitinophagales bacterium]
MSYFIARLISAVFHPISVNVFFLLLLVALFPYYYFSLPNKMLKITLIVLFLMTTLFPALIIFIFRKLNLISDLDISEQKQRILPYLFFFFFYLMSFLLVKPKAQASLIFIEEPYFATALLGATLSIGICFFVNNFIKISAHTTSIASIASFFIFIGQFTSKNLMPIVALLLLLVGLVGASRIYLGRHTQKEAIAGVCSGFIGQMLSVFLYFKPNFFS